MGAPYLGRRGRPGRGVSLRHLRRRKKKYPGACGAPNGFKNVTCSMRIQNMCLVLKIGQRESGFYSERTDGRNIQYRISI